MPGKGWVRSLFQRPEMLDHLRKEFERADTSGETLTCECNQTLTFIPFEREARLGQMNREVR